MARFPDELPGVREEWEHPAWKHIRHAEFHLKRAEEGVSWADGPVPAWLRVARADIERAIKASEADW